MSGKTICLDNRQTRRLWLYLQGLLTTPHGSQSEFSFTETVRQLGMVQLDSINNIARAHHHILWSRHNNYRQKNYNDLLGPQPTVFEHFSHDAAILPLDIHPYWQRQCQRRSDAYKRGTLGKQLSGVKVQKQILSRIAQTGPMCSRDFTDSHTQRADKSLHAWMRPPHKLALDYLWLKGDLCVSHREGFIKYYDLSDRRHASVIRHNDQDETSQIDFLCRSALQRLGFATAREIQGFYDACDLSEVKHWLELNKDNIREITIECHDGSPLTRYAPGNISATLNELPEPCRRLRIINPFDPVVRDRTRLKNVFGMHYRIEIYTPPAKRLYGYYVYPMLDGDRMVGRIDVSADRKKNALITKAWWLEPGVKHSNSRKERLTQELKRIAKLANIASVGPVPPPSRHPDV